MVAILTIQTITRHIDIYAAHATPRLEGKD